jgi:hypothetical protein
MKKIKIFIVSIAIISIVIYGCKADFLERVPLASLDETALANKQGVEGLLIGAYSVLDGQMRNYDAGAYTLGGWQSTGTNWVYGSVTADEAKKGSYDGDQTDINPIERYESTATNDYYNIKWQVVYEGINRTNNVLRIMAKATDISAADQKRITGEARFLRGHYHFDAKKMWNKVPYIDETVDPKTVTNEADIWPQIEADLRFAYENLPGTMSQKGRANKWAAGAMLGKALLFQKKWAEAGTVLNDVYTNGTNAQGQKYQLLTRFQDNFNAETKNSAESVFAIQYSVNDGAPDAANGGWGEVLNFPHTGGPGGCCGFFQPSQDLVNSYQVDANGLPLLNNHNATTVKNDMGVAANAAFTPEPGLLDPRLDWTVGRRGIPFLDWGPHPGVSWIREQEYGGPYSPKKNTYYKSQTGLLTDKSFWTSGVTANNYTLIRFSDVILMLAEAEIETGGLPKAMNLVNEVRSRVANQESWVKTDAGVPAANYKVGLYSSFPDQEYARNAVRFERKLELAMEGHRFFDLVRYGTAAQVLNSYLGYEKQFANYLTGAQFQAGVDEYYPIPQRQIDLSTLGGQSFLTQNPGY